MRSTKTSSEVIPILRIGVAPCSIRLWLFTLGWVAVALQATAQPDLSWQTINGGGGTSTGGVYAVSGTMGQPDTGVSSGGIFRISAGFWSLIELVQTPGAPTLNIASQTAMSFRLTWSVIDAEGYHLQENSSLNSNTWTNVLGTPTLVGDTYQIVVLTNADKHFYRLIKP